MFLSQENESQLRSPGTCLPGMWKAQRNEPSLIHSMINQDMNHLTKDQREEAWNDLHGIDRMQDEDREMITQSLEEFDLEFQDVKAGTILEEVEKMDHAYVARRDLRLMFLRAEHFSPKSAVRRFKAFFEGKLELFGQHCLCRDITLEDLGPECVRKMYDGTIQILPQVDQAGRQIMMAMAALKRSEYSADTLCKYQFYMIMSMLEDEETQRKGIVALLWYPSSQGAKRQVMQKASAQFNYLPVRLNAIHACFQDSILKPVISLALLMLGARARVRYRGHHGSTVENLYSLRSFGIPTECLHFLPDNTYDRSYHQAWLRKRQEKEISAQGRLDKTAIAGDGADEGIGYVSQCDSPNMILDDHPSQFGSTESDGTPKSSHTPLPHGDLGEDRIMSEYTFEKNEVPRTAELLKSKEGYLITNPSPRDVLLGRGKPLQRYPGNIFYRQLVNERLDVYESSNRIEKTIIADDIVQQIKARSGRFLKAKDGYPVSADGTNGTWEEIGDDAARDKVASAFRTVRKQRRKAPS